jgi:hypothetical protein
MVRVLGTVEVDIGCNVDKGSKGTEGGGVSAIRVVDGLSVGLYMGGGLHPGIMLMSMTTSVDLRIDRVVFFID